MLPAAARKLMSTSKRGDAVIATDVHGWVVSAAVDFFN